MEKIESGSGCGESRRSCIDAKDAERLTQWRQKKISRWIQIVASLLDKTIVVLWRKNK